MDTAFGLAGKRILITGGTRGIGRAISSRFAGAGAEVIANYVSDDESAQTLQNELVGRAGSLTLCRADVGAPDGRDRVLSVVGDGPLSAFIHCAATGVHKPLEELTVRHWDFTFAVNVRSFFDLLKALLPRFAEGASVVAISSEGALHAFGGYAITGASKAALESFSRHMSVELAQRGIRVNILSPGTVDTRALESFPNRDALLKAAIARSPRRRLTTVDEVALAAQFLCSDASAGVNGHTLVVDGGQSIRG
jgi:enoyl-[acyl-carrier protein] reductase III